MSIRIVLTRVSHPGNIGSAARAMKTMGLGGLCLVAPDRFPATEATVMAAGADDVLDRALVFPDVPSAVADCGLVVGTTARSRHLPWRMRRAARGGRRECAAAAATSEVAVLFGRRAHRPHQRGNRAVPAAADDPDRARLTAR